MKFQSRVLVAVLLFLTVEGIGTAGYMFLGRGESFLNALYMTVITTTTVGFGEIHPFTPVEKVFTIFLIIISVIMYGYFITIITEYLTTSNFIENLKLKRVKNQISSLSNHTVVCGYGRNGKQAVHTLKQFKQPFLVIEKDPEEIKELEKDEILYILGDATNDEDLLKAGLDRAKSLITALPSDADNLFVVLSARQFNKDFTIISRASNESSYGKLKFAGATNVIMPDKLGGAHMASLVVTPDLIEFVDQLTITGGLNTNLEEISVNDLPAEYLNKTIIDLDLRKKTGCTVIGFKNKKGEYIINPESTSVLERDTYVIVLGRKEQIINLRKLF